MQTPNSGKKLSAFVARTHVFPSGHGAPSAHITRPEQLATHVAVAGIVADTETGHTVAFVTEPVSRQHTPDAQSLVSSHWPRKRPQPASFDWHVGVPAEEQQFWVAVVQREDEPQATPACAFVPKLQLGGGPPPSFGPPLSFGAPLSPRRTHTFEMHVSGWFLLHVPSP